MVDHSTSKIPRHKYKIAHLPRSQAVDMSVVGGRTTLQPRFRCKKPTLKLSSILRFLPCTFLNAYKLSLVTSLQTLQSPAAAALVVIPETSTNWRNTRICEHWFLEVSTARILMSTSLVPSPDYILCHKRGCALQWTHLFPGLAS